MSCITINSLLANNRFLETETNLGRVNKLFLETKYQNILCGERCGDKN